MHLHGWILLTVIERCLVDEGFLPNIFLNMDLLELPESNRLLMEGERLPLALSFLPGLEVCNEACTGVLSTEWVDCMYNIYS